ncbi:MAG: hypothetical protein ACK4SY_08920 [Pyrobaculum sp.]
MAVYKSLRESYEYLKYDEAGWFFVVEMKPRRKFLWREITKGPGLKKTRG